MKIYTILVYEVKSEDGGRVIVFLNTLLARKKRGYYAMKYTFYAILDYKGDKKVLFKCKEMEEQHCLTMTQFLPNQYGGALISYYMVSKDYTQIFELSYGCICSILKFDED